MSVRSTDDLDARTGPHRNAVPRSPCAERHARLDPGGRVDALNCLHSPHQRSTRRPANAPVKVTKLTASVYHTATNKGKSSGQWVA